MNARVVLAGLLVASGAGLYAAARFLHRDVREPNYEYLPADMVRSPASKSMEAAALSVFPDGLVERTPPAGTIARGALPLEFSPGEVEAKRAGEVLVNPYAKKDPADLDDPTVLARGAFVFTNTCAGCHGIAGLGDAPVTKRGFPPPPSLLRPESRALKDGELFHALTYGRKNMPSIASIVDRDDRWKAIVFVRSMQEQAVRDEAARAKAAQETPPGAGDAKEPPR